LTEVEIATIRSQNTRNYRNIVEKSAHLVGMAKNNPAG